MNEQEQAQSTPVERKKLPKKVYTYAVNLPGNNPENETKLLLLWKENWEKHGYEAIVLNEYIAREHRLFDAFDERVRSLPTVNPIAYETACYHRYLAMSVVGGGLMTDHDVLIFDQKFPLGPMPDKVVSFQQHVPCMVWGNKSAYEAVVRQIMEYTVSEKDLEGRQTPHVSDMYMFLRGGISFTSRSLVKSYNEAGWEDGTSRSLFERQHEASREISAPPPPQGTQEMVKKESPSKPRLPANPEQFQMRLERMRKHFREDYVGTHIPPIIASECELVVRAYYGGERKMIAALARRFVHLWWHGFVYHLMMWFSDLVGWTKWHHVPETGAMFEHNQRHGFRCSGSPNCSQDCIERDQPRWFRTIMKWWEK